MRRIICVVLSCFIILGNPCVGYASEEKVVISKFDDVNPITRATDYFSMNVSPNGKSFMAESLSLEAGETVRINATYSPGSASIYVGLIDQDGVFLLSQCK